MDNLKIAAPLAAGVGATAGVIQQIIPNLIPLEDAVIVGLLTLIPLIVSLLQAEIRARLTNLEAVSQTAPTVVPAPVVIHTDAVAVPTPAEQPAPVALVTDPQRAALSTDDLIAELLARLKPNVGGN